MADYSSDIAEIRRIVEGMFQAISWSPDAPPDLEAFAAPVRADASIVPAARPIATTAIERFTRMMAQQRDDGNLVNFAEHALATQVLVFGNVAVALGGFQALINETKQARGANGFLFVRDQDGWKIAGMAWDNESEAHPLPAALVGG